MPKILNLKLSIFNSNNLTYLETYQSDPLNTAVFIPELIDELKYLSSLNINQELGKLEGCCFGENGYVPYLELEKLDIKLRRSDLNERLF